MGEITRKSTVGLMAEKRTTISYRLHEEGIKAIVLSELIRRRRLSRNATIASEYPILGLKVRADLAIYDRSLVGVEIKSAADSIRRLDRQMQAYRMLFDKTILVLASRHTNRIDKKKYNWLEIWQLDNSNKISIIQKPNKTNQKEAVCYKQFMTREDIRRFASARTTNHRRPFLSCFAGKFRATSEEFWASVDGKIDEGNMLHLSRFRSRREIALNAAANKSLGWQNWLLLLRDASNYDVDQSLHASSVSYNPGSPP